MIILLHTTLDSTCWLLKAVHRFMFYESFHAFLAALCARNDAPRGAPFSVCLFPTMLAGRDGVVHDPADQGHEQTQQDEEDPVLPDAREHELLAAGRTLCETETERDTQQHT